MLSKHNPRGTIVVLSKIFFYPQVCHISFLQMHEDFAKFKTCFETFETKFSEILFAMPIAPAYFPLSQCVRRFLFQNVYLAVIVASNWKLVSSVPSFWLLSHARTLSSRSLWEEQIFFYPLHHNNVVAGNYPPLPLPGKNKPDNSTSMTFLFVNYICMQSCVTKLSKSKVIKGRNLHTIAK